MNEETLKVLTNLLMNVEAFSSNNGLLIGQPIAAVRVSHINNEIKKLKIINKEEAA